MKKSVDEQNIAYIVLCHDEPMLLKELSSVLKYGNDRIFIHVDKKQNIDAFLNTLKDEDNVEFINNRHNVYWGGFNSVVATMELLKCVINSQTKYDRIILLQGKDYPLHSPYYIHNFFNEHKNEEFCKAINVTTSKNPSSYMKCHGYWSNDYLRKPIYIKAIHYLNSKLGIKYRNGFFTHDGNKWDTYCGWAQFALSRKCVEYIINVYNTIPSFNKYVRTRYAPDEMYFHTIIYNSKFKNKVSNYYIKPRKNKEVDNSALLNLTYFEYPDYITVFTKNDNLDELNNTGALFIRKLQYEKSLNLIIKINNQIKQEENNH